MSVHCTTTRAVSVPSEAVTVTVASFRTPTTPALWKSLKVPQALFVARTQ